MAGQSKSGVVDVWGKLAGVTVWDRGEKKEEPKLRKKKRF